MPKFIDEFTGTVYQIGPEWLKTVQKTIADRILGLLQGKSQIAANEVANFWGEEYYAQIFPLRFGVNQDDSGVYNHADLFAGNGQGLIDLESLIGKPTRTRFLDQDHLPPLLPIIGAEETRELLADRLLTQTALANLLLREQGVDGEMLHHVRLACLIYPLLPYLEERLEKAWPEVLGIARFLSDKEQPLPSGLPIELMASIRDLTGFGELKIGLGCVAVERIKRYVFETPGLNEIRGASTLLDDLTLAAKEWLATELGSEVVLRAVGSALVFLTPTEKEAQQRVEWISQAFYQATGTTFMTSTYRSVAVTELLTDYPRAFNQAVSAQEKQRSVGEQPVYEALPFEARCGLCRTRPAEGWGNLPGQADPVPLCRVCRTKRGAGRPEREEKVEQMLRWLQVSHPRSFGVAGDKPEDYLAQSLGLVDDEEPGFIPGSTRRPLLATIYGDGNNFGAVGKKLTSMAQARQWTQRVEKTTRAAAAIALARATQETAKQKQNVNDAETSLLPRIPFQVLALGGDDISLFAWAPVGIRFAGHFVRIVDQEFQVGSRPPLVPQTIAFSLGVLLTDHKAAARRTVAFAENELLHWAKQAFRDSKLTQGTIAPLLANNLEQIPDDLERYRLKMYRRQGALTLYLTLRPFSAEELAWLLQQAATLRDVSGPFHRLVSVFIRSSPLQGMLHYVYQYGRFSKVPGHWLKQLEEKSETLPSSLEDLAYPATAKLAYPSQPKSPRKPFGLTKKDERTVWFTPLWDLLELVKILE